MKISEIAQITGLSVSNIRFYERKGLVNPDRRIDSKYRDYTTQDVELIKRIVLYRKMDLSIEEIQNIVKDDMDDKQIVKNHLSELERKREMINNSMVLCEMFVYDEDNVDVDYYLNYVNQEENNGSVFAKVDELYNEFEEFSKNTILPDYSIVSAYVPEQWRKRIGVFVWCLAIVGTPLVALLHIGEEGFLRVIIMWGVWCVLFLVGFLNFRKESNK